jgi:1,4-alpha-glucan branching enzyme
VPLAQDQITPDTPLGATLTGNGATFRVWAPLALGVYLRIGTAPTGWKPGPSNELVKDAQGYWGGFVSGVGDGTPYRFYVVGPAGEGLKRDPYAREVGHAWPDCDCFVRDPQEYPWHDQDYRTPAWNDLIVYQLHIGAYTTGGTFLDVIDKIPHLAALGVNAIEPLPIVEFETQFSMGYNGVDLFSPEMNYSVLPANLGPYLTRINALLAAKGKQALAAADIASQVGQLRALVDLCHVYGIAVLFDVVYNHAGGGFDPQSLYFFDFEPDNSNNDSLYFTDQGWAGGLVFAYWKDEVRQFLIDNAAFFLSDYHIDGMRYDEVTVIDNFGGWRFCQDLTNTLHFRNPSAIHIAEYWRDDQSWVIKRPDQGGAGFDAVWSAGLRGVVRSAIGSAAQGSVAWIDMDAVSASLNTPAGLPAAWCAVQHLENHDLVYLGHSDRVPRIPALGDATDSYSWYARSRARVATGLLLTAPGIPMLFMGEEFLDDEPWSDDLNAPVRIGWDRLASNKVMQDFLVFCRDLVWLRRRQPALRGAGLHVFHVHDDNRVLAFQRWAEGEGRDVVVVVSLCENTYYGYTLGFPGTGSWLEVFNGDFYDTMPNSDLKGNGGLVSADGPPMHGLPASAAIVIPANGLLVFARDRGD